MGDARRLERAMNDGTRQPDEVNERGFGNIAPLHAAARQGHDDCVRILIAGGAEIDMTTHGGLTSLHAAARAGNDAVVRSETSGIRTRTRWVAASGCTLWLTYMGANPTRDSSLRLGRQLGEPHDCGRSDATPPRGCVTTDEGYAYPDRSGG